MNGITLDIEYQYVYPEERFREVGMTATGRFLEVVTTWRRDRIRVVSAFDATETVIAEYLRQR